MRIRQTLVVHQLEDVEVLPGQLRGALIALMAQLPQEQLAHLLALREVGLVAAFDELQCHASS